MQSGAETVDPNEVAWYLLDAAGRPGAEVTLSVGEEHAEIAVADHGDGCFADTAKTMFQPFSKSARGGMGLGLAICQRIATSLGGSLSWENRGAVAARSSSSPFHWQKKAACSDGKNNHDRRRRPGLRAVPRQHAVRLGLPDLRQP